MRTLLLIALGLLIVEELAVYLLYRIRKGGANARR